MSKFTDLTTDEMLFVISQLPNADEHVKLRGHLTPYSCVAPYRLDPMVTPSMAKYSRFELITYDFKVINNKWMLV